MPTDDVPIPKGAPPSAKKLDDIFFFKTYTAITDYILIFMKWMIAIKVAKKSCDFLGILQKGTAFFHLSDSWHFVFNYFMA